MEYIQGVEKEMTKQYRDFKSARKFVRKLKLTGNREWRKYCKSGNKPDDMPTNPWRSYKE